MGKIRHFIDTTTVCQFLKYNEKATALAFHSTMIKLRCVVVCPAINHGRASFFKIRSSVRGLYPLLASKHFKHKIIRRYYTEQTEPEIHALLSSCNMVKGIWRKFFALFYSVSLAERVAFGMVNFKCNLNRVDVN